MCLRVAGLAIADGHSERPPLQSVAEFGAGVHRDSKGVGVARDPDRCQNRDEVPAKGWNGGEYPVRL